MTTTLALDCPVQISGRPPLHPGRPRGEHQRMLLLALVEADPGIHVLRAAHLLDINWNTCEYHSRRLASEGRIIIRKVQGRLCLFGGRDGSSAARIPSLLLRDARTAALVELVLVNPGVNQKTMARQLGIPESAVHRHVLRLERAGLVQRVPHSRAMANYPTKSLVEAWSARGQIAGPLMPALPAALAAEA